MIVLDQTRTRTALQWGPLIGALDKMFRSDCRMPVRHHHDVTVPGEPDATLLLMPAWLPGDYIGVKMVNVFPGNTVRGLPAIFGSYLLSSGRTGELLAVLDGGELTARRTAAASALAARYLARADASHMLMVGTGRLSVNLVAAHSAERPLRTVSVWGRDMTKAKATVKELAALGIEAEATADLERAARQADIISCATLSSEPLVRGAWLKPGAHLDLVGAFKPSMRESDDDAMARGRIFADTRAGVLSEGGDIIQALQSGAIAKDAIVADLFGLCRGENPGRVRDDDITVFKSVGAALEDLAGAILAYGEHRKTS